MRVAIFSDTYKPQVNGVVNCIDTLDKHYRKMGIKTMIIAPTGTKYKFTSLTVPFYKEFESAIFPYPKAVKIIKKFKPDIIHSHTQFNMGIAALAARKILKVPMVTTFHTLIPDYFGHYFFDSKTAKRILWKYFTKYFKRCDAVTTPSDLIKKEIEKRFNRKVLVIRNGVDTKRFNPRKKSNIYRKYGIKKNYKVVLHVGRLSKERNIADMIRAFDNISKKRNDAKFVIVGRGPKEEKFRAMAKYNKNIIFTGFVPDRLLPEFFASAYVFVSPSKTDVYPLIILEACASGLPMIGTKVGGVGRIINSRIGFRYSNLKEMEKQLNHVLDNKKARDRLATNARKFAEAESWDSKAKEFIGLYKKLIRDSK
ncbi:MAG: glycosyltransferase [Candidatus Aenigmatarchaeota archaeon]